MLRTRCGINVNPTALVEGSINNIRAFIYTRKIYMYIIINIRKKSRNRTQRKNPFLNRNTNYINVMEEITNFNSGNKSIPSIRNVLRTAAHKKRPLMKWQR